LRRFRRHTSRSWPAVGLWERRGPDPGRSRSWVCVPGRAIGRAAALSRKPPVTGTMADPGGRSFARPAGVPPRRPLGRVELRSVSLELHATAAAGARTKRSFAPAQRFGWTGRQALGRRADGGRGSRRIAFVLSARISGPSRRRSFGKAMSNVRDRASGRTLNTLTPELWESPPNAVANHKRKHNVPNHPDSRASAHVDHGAACRRRLGCCRDRGLDRSANDGRGPDRFRLHDPDGRTRCGLRRNPSSGLPFQLARRRRAGRHLDPRRRERRMSPR
jgi:hypothetical protein